MPCGTAKPPGCNIERAIRAAGGRIHAGGGFGDSPGASSLAAATLPNLLPYLKVHSEDLNPMVQHHIPQHEPRGVHALSASGDAKLRDEVVGTDARSMAFGDKHAAPPLEGNICTIPVKTRPDCVAHHDRVLNKESTGGSCAQLTVEGHLKVGSHDACAMVEKEPLTEL